MVGAPPTVLHSSGSGWARRYGETELEGCGSLRGITSRRPLPLGGALSAPASLATVAHILLGWVPEAAALPGQQARRLCSSPSAPPPQSKGARGPRFLWLTLLFVGQQMEAKGGNVNPGSWAAQYWPRPCVISAPGDPSCRLWWELVVFPTGRPHSGRCMLGAQHMRRRWLMCDLNVCFSLWLANKHTFSSRAAEVTSWTSPCLRPLPRTGISIPVHTCSSRFPVHVFFSPNHLQSKRGVRTLVK